MKKCIIVCWYGKLPDYYIIWEKSCSKNTDYDFIIFTDQKIEKKYDNFKIYYMTLNEISSLFSSKLKLNINIKKPYKLCDFKPLYGKVFNDYIKKYDFWGHCDVDQIFGKISDFVTDELLKKYEIINQFGHFRLFKNNDKINNLYKNKGTMFNYKEVFTSDNNYAFDEYSGINLIIKKNNIKLFNINDFCDIDVKHKRYICFNSNNYKEQCYSYENDKLYKNYIKDGKLFKEEKMYLHFQKKKPAIMVNSSDNNYLIGKEGIFPFVKIDKKTINKFNSKPPLFKEFCEVIQYYIFKITKFMRCSKKDKLIWIKQKFRK